MANPLTLLMPVIPGTDPKTIAAALAKHNAEIDAALDVRSAPCTTRASCARHVVAQPAAGRRDRPVRPRRDHRVRRRLRRLHPGLRVQGGSRLRRAAAVRGRRQGGDAGEGQRHGVRRLHQAANDASQHPGNTGLYQAYTQRCSRFSPPSRPSERGRCRALRIDYADVQGTILRGYRVDLARHFILSVTERRGARAFIGSLVDGTGGCRGSRRRRAGR